MGLTLTDLQLLSDPDFRFELKDRILFSQLDSKTDDENQGENTLIVEGMGLLVRLILKEQEFFLFLSTDFLALLFPTTEVLQLWSSSGANLISYEQIKNKVAISYGQVIDLSFYYHNKHQLVPLSRDRTGSENSGSTRGTFLEPVNSWLPVSLQKGSSTLMTFHAILYLFGYQLVYLYDDAVIYPCRIPISVLNLLVGKKTFYEYYGYRISNLSHNRDEYLRILDRIIRLTKEHPSLVSLTRRYLNDRSRRECPELEPYERLIESIYEPLPLLEKNITEKDYEDLILD